MDTKTLSCGCVVDVHHDALQRIVGRILEKGVECPRVEHAIGRVVLLPGREHARPGDGGGV